MSDKTKCDFLIRIINVKYTSEQIMITDVTKNIIFDKLLIPVTFFLQFGYLENILSIFS